MTQDLSSEPAEALAGEHEVQVRLLRAVEALLERQGNSEALSDALAQLVDYTSVHFLSEQLLMRLYSYPQHDAHAIHHTELLERLQALRDEVESEQTGAAGPSLNSLRRSILDHIANEDSAFSRYLADLNETYPVSGSS